MLKLMKSIKSDAKRMKITGISIAKWIGVSEGMVTKYYKAESDMPAIKFIDLVSFIYEEDPKEIKRVILEFISKTTRTDNFKELLEWAANSGDIDYIDSVQDRVNDFTDLCIDKEIYKMMRERNSLAVTPEEFYLKIEDFKMSKYLSDDSIILLKIATMYSLFDLKSYSVMVPLGLNIIENLCSLTSDYIKESFKVRTLEMLAQAYLRLNNTKEIELIGQSLITSESLYKFPLPGVALLRIMAEANVFNDYKKSLEYINQALEIFHKKKINHERRKLSLEATRDFIKIFHSDFNDLFLSDPSEKAHFYSKTGESSQALEILDKLQEENGGLSGYQLYYKGLATGEDKYLHEALNVFIRKGDTFYAKLVTK
jgi:hypothetical protein